jgi:hypothetical protein
MIISIYVEKLFNKIQHFLMIKALKQLAIKWTDLNIVKTIYDKPIATSS